ncbi:MAG: beta galactosidase jelly roll domain-containing protein [Acidobacteria bacterium]|nr:beta galactosidase jelly roll domain-containing protein [Acidobacteriota bacterium]
MRARLALLLLTLALTAAARDRAIISDNWRFQVDIDELGEKEQWHRAGFDTSLWSKVQVPGAWDLYNTALRGFEGVGWYTTTLSPGLAHRDKVQCLRFGRAMYHTKVWLNGEYLGENIGGYLPFEFDVTGKLRAGSANVVMLRVDNRPRLEWLPASRNIEWFQYGGILEPVLLETMSQTWLDDVTITATPRGDGATIDCAVQVASRSPQPGNLEVTAEVRELKSTARAAVHAASARLILNPEHASAWSPRMPTLYNLTITLKGAGQVLDSWTSRIGIRKLETRGRQTLLNDQPLRLQGVNRYDEYGRYGPNAPRALVVDDLRRMKAAGINIVRVHYPQSPELLALYDEMGFLMSEEVTINWWGNGFSGTGKEIQSDAILTYAIPFLERMIRRDKNHPSVAIWSMCNESKTDNEVGIRVMRTLLRRARELDRTRLLTFVINNRDTDTHRAFEDADLVAFNIYVGGYQGKAANHIAEVRELIGKAADEHIRKQLAFWPDKPMLVTEYGTPGIPGVHGDVTYTEEYQAALIEEVGRAIQRAPELTGGILWSWADYYHRPNYIKYAPFGPYGVVTVDRKPKLALKSLVKLYGGRILPPTP